MRSLQVTQLAVPRGVRAKLLPRGWDIAGGWLLRLAMALSFFAGPSARAATLPYIENTSITTNALIDATTYVNSGTLRAEGISFGQLFQTLNNLNFTNAGQMIGDLGFNLQFVTNASRFPANAIVNQSGATVSGQTILLSATNLINAGELRAGLAGLLQLNGRNVNLSRSILSVTDAIGLTGTGIRFVNTNGIVIYQNPNAVADFHWGAGTGNVMNSFSGVNLGLVLPSLNLATGGLRPPSVSTPLHEVESARGGISLPALTNFSGTNFSAHVRTSTFGTNVIIQVVLVQTNIANTNLAVDVRFINNFGVNSFPGNVPAVRFRSSGLDFTTGLLYTNSLYLFDYLNLFSSALLSANQQTSSARPAAYEVSRLPANDSIFNSPTALTTNENIANITYHQPGFAQAIVTNNLYAAYHMAVGNAAFVPGNSSAPHLNDPTNFSGRVEIYAENLDMSTARIRAENLVSIRATNLLNFEGALIEAPNVQIAIANTNSTLTLTNFTPTEVARPNGTVFFYSTVWTNAVTNATPQLDLRYHVLIVDASQLSGITPINLQEFSVRGTNVIINNALKIGRILQVNSPAVTFSASSTLDLPLTTANSLSTTSNFPEVRFFTNLGSISVPLQCTLGPDRAQPIDFFLNRGVITADNISIRASVFESSGTNQTRALVNGTSVGGIGPISIVADTAKFDGGGSGGIIAAGGNILLAGNDIKIRNHLLTTAKSLILSPTNSLTDTGASGTNRINCALGFSLTVKPTSGDLLGTTIHTTTPFVGDIPHSWAGTDLGPVPAGFTNNAAVGRLLLDTGNNAASLGRFSFAGVGTRNALYVDYLDLAGTINNNLSAHLVISNNFTIYFANASRPPETLDGQLGGRLRWVKDYAGPNTGVDVLLPDGRTTKVNVAKLNSLILDSDADGIVNGIDLSPFDGVVIDSRVTFTNVPPLTAFVTWEAAAQTVYRVESNTNLLTSTWQFSANFTNSAATNRVVSYSEPVPLGALERYYRVSYQP